jgi:hypothetical protein
VVSAFRELDSLFDRNQGRWGAYPSSNNILLAYASHPLKRGSRTARRAVAALKRIQKPDGTWKDDPFFFHTFHALSQSALPGAVEQFEKAFRHLVETQNPDGTWGRRDWEWNSFLALDSLARRGYKTKRHALKRFYDVHHRDVLRANRLLKTPGSPEPDPLRRD